MSKYGPLSVKFLKSMCLNNVHPKIIAIPDKNRFIPFLSSIFSNVLILSQLLFLKSLLIK